jgi:universal stress protein A
MGTYNRILVLLDCSPVDEAILCHIGNLARSESASVVLVHVVHSHTLDQDRALREKALKCMESRTAQLAASGVTADTLLLSGEPEVELVKEIRSGNYDLVALATHGHRLLAESCTAAYPTT